MSAAPETLGCRYLKIGQNIWLCGTQGALSAHHATANQPIDQALVVEAYRKLRPTKVVCHGQVDFNC